MHCLCTSSARAALLAAHPAHNQQPGCAGASGRGLRARARSLLRVGGLTVISRRAVHALCSYELCYEPHNEAHNGPAAAMSLLIVVLTSGVSIMRSDVSPPGANSALLAFHYEQIPHNEANTLTSVLTVPPRGPNWGVVHQARPRAPRAVPTCSRMWCDMVGSAAIWLLRPSSTS